MKLGKNVKRATHKKRYISPEEKTNYWWIKVSTKKGCIILEIIDELMLTLKIYISWEKRQQVIVELRLV